MILYRSKLDRFDPDVVSAVIEEAIVSAKSFPTIAELRHDCGREIRRRQEAEALALPMGRSPMPESVREELAKLDQRFAERAKELEG